MRCALKQSFIKTLNKLDVLILNGMKICYFCTYAAPAESENYIGIIHCLFLKFISNNNNNRAIYIALGQIM